MGMVTNVYQTIQSSLNKMDATLSQLHSTQRDQAVQMQQGVTNQLAAQLAIFNNLDNVSQLDAQKGEVSTLCSHYSGDMTELRCVLEHLCM